MTLRRVAWIVLAGYGVILTFAPFFATSSPSTIDTSLPYLPPEGIHLTSPTGRFSLRPYVAVRQPETGPFAVYTGHVVLVPLRFLVTTRSEDGVHLRFCGFDHGTPHFLGTDEFGRDLWSRLTYGGRTTLAIGVAASATATLLALIVGVVAGSAGRTADIFLMRLVESVISVPWFYLLLAVRALLPLRISPWWTATAMTALMACIGWAGPARILRGAVMAAHQHAYVEVSRATGASRWHIARWHTLADVAPQAITQFTVLLPQFVASEVVLSYFGLGVADPLVSWGAMLASAQHLSSVVDYPWLLAPMWAMIPFFFCVHQLADHRSTMRWLTLSVLTRPSYRIALPKGAR